MFVKGGAEKSEERNVKLTFESSRNGKERGVTCFREEVGGDFFGLHFLCLRWGFLSSGKTPKP